MHHFAREVGLGLGLAVFCLGLSGCGGSEPPAPPAAEAPKPAVADAPKAGVKSKGKKGGDPTADMELKEVRAYRRAQKAAGNAP